LNNKTTFFVFLILISLVTITIILNYKQPKTSRNKKPKIKRILTYGTFDLFHYGHQRLFDNIVRLLGKNIEIHVGISSDRFNSIKGKNAVDSFEVRCKNVKKHPNVVATFLEDDWNQKIEDIKRIEPDYFIMGSDWTGKFDKLEEYCNVVYLPRTPNISSSMLREDIMYIDKDFTCDGIEPEDLGLLHT